MKKKLLYLLVPVLVVAFVSCSSGSDDDPTPDNPETPNNGQSICGIAGYYWVSDAYSMDGTNWTIYKGAQRSGAYYEFKYIAENGNEHGKRYAYSITESGWIETNPDVNKTYIYNPKLNVLTNFARNYPNFRNDGGYYINQDGDGKWERFIKVSPPTIIQ